jgi:hypothetical protein
MNSRLSRALVYFIAMKGITNSGKIKALNQFAELISDERREFNEYTLLWRDNTKSKIYGQTPPDAIATAGYSEENISHIQFLCDDKENYYVCINGNWEPIVTLPDLERYLKQIALKRRLL